MVFPASLTVAPNETTVTELNHRLISLITFPYIFGLKHLLDGDLLIFVLK